MHQYSFVSLYKAVC